MEGLVRPVLATKHRCPSPGGRCRRRTPWGGLAPPPAFAHAILERHGRGVVPRHVSVPRFFIADAVVRSPLLIAPPLAGQVLPLRVRCARAEECTRQADGRPADRADLSRTFAREAVHREDPPRHRPAPSSAVMSMTVYGLPVDIVKNTSEWPSDSALAAPSHGPGRR